jgi:microcystin-dependent protein
MSGSLGSVFFLPVAQIMDPEGVPYEGAQLFFYVTGTSTPLDVYADVNLSTPLGNPVESDSQGFFPVIYLSQSQAYKVLAYTPNPNPAVPSTPSSPQGTQLWAADPVGNASQGSGQNVAGMLCEVRMFAGPAANIPNQWYVCDGSAVSRTTFAAAFAIMGTTFGAGDGTTTFNIPDLRGRVMAGLDNMGGTAAGRITAAVCSVPGATLGGAGGGQNAQQDTLTAVSTVTDAGHAHAEYLPTLGNVASGGPITVAGPPVVQMSQETAIATTGVTVATNVTSSLTGTTQNVQPTMMLNAIIYLGA